MIYCNLVCQVDTNDNVSQKYFLLSSAAMCNDSSLFFGNHPSSELLTLIKRKK